MPRRSTILFLIACLFGTPVLIHAYRVGQHCAAITGQTEGSPFVVSDPTSLCRAVGPDPLWARGFGVLSLASLVAAGIGLSRGLAARRHERKMLAQVGVKVKEEDLFLEE